MTRRTLTAFVLGAVLWLLAAPAAFAQGRGEPAPSGRILPRGLGRDRPPKGPGDRVREERERILQIQSPSEVRLKPLSPGERVREERERVWQTQRGERGDAPAAEAGRPAALQKPSPKGGNE